MITMLSAARLYQHAVMLYVLMTADYCRAVLVDVFVVLSCCMCTLLVIVVSARCMCLLDVKSVCIYSLFVVFDRI